MATAQLCKLRVWLKGCVERVSKDIDLQGEKKKMPAGLPVAWNHLSSLFLSEGPGEAGWKEAPLGTQEEDPGESSGATQKTSHLAGGQGYAGMRSGKRCLNPVSLVLVSNLHSRREDFNPVFARHSDGDSARAPGKTIGTATPPELVSTVPSSSGVS